MAKRKLCDQAIIDSGNQRRAAYEAVVLKFQLKNLSPFVRHQPGGEFMLIPLLLNLAPGVGAPEKSLPRGALSLPR